MLYSSSLHVRFRCVLHVSIFCVNISSMALQKVRDAFGRQRFYLISQCFTQSSAVDKAHYD